MVQLTDHSLLGQGKAVASSLDPYWKLDNDRQYGSDRKTLLGILENKNFSCASNTPWARLQELYVRCQRGLLSYERMKSPELRYYTSQRNLPIAAESTVASLKAQLEQADEDATFEGFQVLPAELRVRIYTHYFNSFIGTRASIVSQPPITGASQQIRKESLPVFYGCCNFQIHTMVSVNSLGNSCYKPQTARLVRLAADHFGWIQHITMRLDLIGCEVELKIEINNKRTPIKVSHLLKGSLIHSSQKQRERVSLELGLLVSDIVAREGGSKVQGGDLKWMHQIVRNILIPRGN